LAGNQHEEQAAGTKVKNWKSDIFIRDLPSRKFETFGKVGGKTDETAACFSTQMNF
jgi:hypothetical protein